MPAEITLPPFLKEKLEQAPHRHVVHKALENFSDWFRSSRLPFFPDYTDHGIQHIEQVLATAANLIPDQARAYFSGADAVALILAVLLHDSALHLTEAGVWQLLKDPAAPYRPIASFDQEGWAQTWDDFMFLARRWDDTKLAQVFGSAEPGGLPTAAVRDPFAHWQNLTRTDHLLLGEFIRQQHPRLAHEMALHGVPGTAGALLRLDDSLPAEWRDLVGLIARSHGLPLRTCLDYLKTSPDFGEYARREYQGVHAVYLMALLRVADYVQIQGDRTSDRVFRYKKIYSSISTIEHKVHQAVRSITNTTDDPEALAIQARPEEVSVFLRLKEWLAGIQQELDGSWAVLGEVYGRHEQLRHLGLTFRRVLSNLDNVAEFAKTVPYVPDRIRFDVARAELLKLLIGPLYGDDPSYGVRELMQNAIDAVREYDQFVLDNPQYASVPRREQEADVVVELGPLDEATGYATMTISDRGIGMTESTIRDYFLRAGASHRQSADWKAAFAEYSGCENKSKVLRAGRFGVGALAAFLLAPELEVVTRYIAAAKGYSFTTNLTADVIELRQVTTIPVGTIIKMRVGQEIYQKLTSNVDIGKLPKYWDWYCLPNPSLHRNLITLKNNATNSRLAAKWNIDIKEWRKLPDDFGYDIYWNFDEAPVLTCNGLFITNDNELKKMHLKDLPGNATKSRNLIRLPNVMIFDPNGYFPLNLRRDGITTEKYPFSLALMKDFLSEMLAWLLFNTPSSSTVVEDNHVPFYRWIVGVSKEAIIISGQKFALKIATTLHDLKLRHSIEYIPGIEFSVANQDTLLFSNIKIDEMLDFRAGPFVNAFIDKPKDERNANRLLIFSDNSLSHREINEHIIKCPDYTARKYEEVYEKTTVDCPPKEYEVASRFKKAGIEKIRRKNYIQPLLKETFYPSDTLIKVTSTPWLLDELWLEYFGREWIPYDLKERIDKFPQAARFFAERYPQVVPNEAWALLGGKPTPA
jgi:molecular chaperone HtpG